MHSTLPAQQERPVRTCPPEGARRPGRLAALDGLRLLAALMVVAYHYLAFDSGAWPRPPREAFPHAHLPAAYGWLGVQLFFLISGFVICMTCWDRSPGQFALSRVRRLFPLYWFAVPAVALVATLWPSVGGVPRPRDVAVNLTMLQAPLGVEAVDGVYWTLWVELRFYLLIALLARKGLTHGRAVGFCVLWALGAALATATDDALLRELLLPRHCWYFIAGTAFYLMHRFGPNLVLWIVTGGCFLVAQHQLPTLQSHAEGHLGHRVPHWPAALLVTLFFLALAAVALGWTRTVRWRWLTVAGALTYPLYLLHERIGWTVIKHADGLLPRSALVAALVAGMLSASWLAHRFVERPLAAALGRGLRQAGAAVRTG
ncbi:acyltransferase family protein [Streptomyces gamaensis]|uniref:Acyltransferase family protein n=1 Tax=Streptomyces gamaensis TaxID=1763542 RepID=A0ABW0Z194_9ACTN